MNKRYIYLYLLMKAFFTAPKHCFNEQQVSILTELLMAIMTIISQFLIFKNLTRNYGFLAKLDVIGRYLNNYFFYLLIFTEGVQEIEKHRFAVRPRYAFVV